VSAGESEVKESGRPDPSQVHAGQVRPSIPNGRPAVFLDRDGTIIEHVHYLSDPRQVRLLPGAAAAIGRLRAAGYACVVVTNQSAIGRGFITEAQLDAIHDEMNRQLAAAGTGVDGIEFCPERPRSKDLTVIDHIDRKPGPGMLYRATATLGLNLDASWMIGDMLSDVLAGLNAGCRGSILVRTGKPLDNLDLATVDRDFHIKDNLDDAADLILKACD
jgi:D-glycero-D-manno-heptose 1,7-bisphosphate phosphatase